MKKPIIGSFILLVILFALSSCAKKEAGLNYKAVEGGIEITGYTDKTTVTEIAVPDEISGQPVIRIADFGICNAESLTKITIGKNVKEIDGWALTNNQHLKEFIVDPANENFTAVDGVLFSKDMKTLYYYPCGKGVNFDKFGRALNGVTYDIPEGVETIRTKAFYKCGHTDIASFPSTLKTIEEKAFFKCYYWEEFSKDNVVESGLSTLTLPEGLEKIGKDAFAYDEKLENMTIPAAITEIGDYAFFNCTGLTKITILAKEENIKLGARWQPTAEGRIKKDCVITFAE